MSTQGRACPGGPARGCEDDDVYQQSQVPEDWSDQWVPILPHLLSGRLLGMVPGVRSLQRELTLVSAGTHGDQSGRLPSQRSPSASASHLHAPTLRPGGCSDIPAQLQGGDASGHVARTRSSPRSCHPQQHTADGRTVPWSSMGTQPLLKIKEGQKRGRDGLALPEGSPCRARHGGPAQRRVETPLHAPGLAWERPACIPAAGRA